MLELEHVEKRFAGRVAVAGVDLRVGPGEVVGLLGPNGAGKTTIMRMIAGVLEPDAGRVRVLGRDVVEDRREALTGLGHLPEGAPLWDDMRPVEHLRFLGAARGLTGATLRDAIERALARADLESVRDRPIGALSKGFRRRVALAGAILHDPPVLLLDEPTDGLDPNQKRGARALIRELAPGRAILISTHALEEVEAVCDRVALIAGGRLLADETPAALAARTPTGRLDDAFAALTAGAPA
jgi:ABC-2 type transport system ATP-binding protein